MSRSIPVKDKDESWFGDKAIASNRRESVFLRERTIFIFEWKVVILDLGEVDKYSFQLPPYSMVVCPDDLRNIKSQGHESNFVCSFFFSLSFVAIMGCDGFPFCWDTCHLGDGCTLQCSTVSLNIGTAPFISPSFFFFQKIFWLSVLSLFQLS